MQKDSLPTRILKIILAVLVTVLAVSALAAVTALLLYGLVLAAVALVLLFILSPEDLRAFVKAAGERIDGWIGRLEGSGAASRRARRLGRPRNGRARRGRHERPPAQTGQGDGLPASGEPSEKA
ncbi:MAG: hypothetical protein ACLUNV_04850 [Sutterella wadsworthensis]